MEAGVQREGCPVDTSDTVPSQLAWCQWQVLAFTYYATSASAVLSRACVLISKMGGDNANPPRLLCR